MTITVWLSLFSICLLGAMSPGPSLTIVAKHSLASGRVHGIAVAWSHAMGIGLYASIAIMGLSVMMEQTPLIFKGITLAGAAYLIYLGTRALRSTGGLAAKLASGEKTSILEGMRESFLISILSPKIMLFFTALFSPFIAIANDVFDQLVIVFTPLLIDGLWYSLIATFLTNTKVINTVRAKALIIDRLSGVILILLALRVIYTI
ncbi:MAG: LysE family translocator [Marinomonas sp.]|uniref:LysE family translocator n=1 Tax=Marinomonas sp. TaxID=1904862 RepID=UPI003C764965